MILTLEVSAPQGAEPGVLRRQTFNEEGGTIGRGTECSWMLPHGKISGRHAVITCRNAVFYIEDTSRNGVCINSSDNRLARGRPYALKSGDRIFIDPYEIYVSISGDSDASGRRPLVSPSDARSTGVGFDESSPFGHEDPFAPRSGSLFESSSVSPPAEAMAGEELDPLKLLGGASPKTPPARPAPSVRDLAQGSVLEAHYRPPAVLPSPSPAPPHTPYPDAGLIPRDYDPLAPDDSVVMPATPPPVLPPEPVPARSIEARQTPPPSISPAPVKDEEAATPVPSAPAAASAEVGAPVWAEMLAAAGLDGAVVTPEFAHSFGQILRVVVAGVMDVLQARQQIKDEFRMRMTHFRAADNNPLKFSANVEDALHNLLVKRNAAYLAPVEAFADAFDDLRNHQIAMLAGMRVAFESMLAEFDPDRLQEKFDRQLSKGSLLSVPAKLRYWDLYRDGHRDMVKDPEESFRNLFGEEFARAYEEQLRRLKGGSASERGKDRR